MPRVRIMFCIRLSYILPYDVLLSTPSSVKSSSKLRNIVLCYGSHEKDEQQDFAWRWVRREIDLLPLETAEELQSDEDKVDE